MKILNFNKVLALTAASFMLVLSVGCGNSNSNKSDKSNSGASTEQKAFENYADAALECDAEDLVKCVPTKVMKYLENEYNLTESQLFEKIESELDERHCAINYVGEKFANWDVEDINFKISVDEKEEISADNLQKISGKLTANGGKTTEKGYYIFYSVDGAEDDIQENNIIEALGYDRYNNRNVGASQVYEQDGKWYSYEALLVAVSAAQA